MHRGVGIAAVQIFLHAEHAAGVFRSRAIYQTEHFIHGQHQITGDLAHKALVRAGVQLVVQDIQAVGDELFVESGQHAAAEHAVLCAFGAGDILHRKGETASVRAAAQQVIAGNAVIISHAHHKFKPAFADAFFVVRQQRLGNAQIFGGLLLRHALFFAQKRDDPAEIRYHYRIPLTQLRTVNYSTAKTFCKYKNFRKNPTARPGPTGFAISSAQRRPCA